MNVRVEMAFFVICEFYEESNWTWVGMIFLNWDHSTQSAETMDASLASEIWDLVPARLVALSNSNSHSVHQVTEHQPALTRTTQRADMMIDVSRIAFTTLTMCLNLTILLNMKNWYNRLVSPLRIVFILLSFLGIKFMMTNRRLCQSASSTD